jgi:uncharacterized membrane protein YagU involved in acid resistance
MIAENVYSRTRRAIHDATAEDDDILKGAVAGLAAGLIAALVMDGVEKVFLSGKSGGQQPGHEEDANIPRYTPEAQHQPYMPSGHIHHQPEEGQTATQKTATALAGAVGVTLNKTQREAGGAAVHLGFAASVGALYGALAEVTPVVSIGMGVPYGAAVWLLADETALSLLGLEKPPQHRPASTHAASFGMHLIYGATLDLLRRGIRTLL